MQLSEGLVLSNSTWYNSSNLFACKDINVCAHFILYYPFYWKNTFSGQTACVYLSIINYLFCQEKDNCLKVMHGNVRVCCYTEVHGF